jgi:hypothetical protein
MTGHIAGRFDYKVQLSNSYHLKLICFRYGSIGEFKATGQAERVSLHDRERARCPMAAMVQPMALGYTGSGLPASAHICSQRLQFLAGCALGRTLDFSVARNKGQTERRQHGAAAISATRLTFHRRAPADTVDLVDEIPGSLVGHVHRAPRSRNRAAGAYILKQLDFAGTDPTLRVQIDTNAQGWERCRRRLLHVRLAHVISARTSDADLRTATLEPFRF